MKLNKNKKLNLGILVDRPFPHPSGKDQKGIMLLAFDLTDCIYELYAEMILMQENILAEKLIKASVRHLRSMQNAFATANESEYRNETESVIDALVEIRFWLKELQMKYEFSTLSDESVEKVNALIIIVNYLAGKTQTNTVRAGFLTVN